MNSRDLTYCTIILFLLFWIAVFYRGYLQFRQSTKNLESVIREKDDSIRYHRNEQGRMVAEKAAAEVQIKDLKTTYPALVESLRKDFDIKLRDLKVYVRNEFIARGEGQGQIVNNHYYDSATDQTIRWKDFKMDDGYLKFNTTIYDSLTTLPLITATSQFLDNLNGQYQYQYRDTAQTVIHRRKRWLLGNEHLYSSTLFSNPNARVINTTNVLIKDYKDRRWNISIGIYGDPFRLTWGPAVTVGYSLIKF